MKCPTCEMAGELEGLRQKAKEERNASGGKVWIKESTQLSDETVITILGEIQKDHWNRLLALTLDIEAANRRHSPHPSHPGDCECPECWHGMEVGGR